VSRGARFGVNAKWTRIAIGVDVDYVTRWLFVDVLLGPIALWVEVWNTEETAS